MSDLTPGEMPTTPATETGAATEPKAQSETLSVEERIAQAVSEATKKANAEAAKFRKQLDAFEKAAQAQKDAELSETEKLRKSLEETAAQLKAVQTDNLRRRIAADVGLPAELVDRLRGESEDELKADAQALLKLIPKAPKVPATMPGEAKSETIYDKGKRLLSESNTDIWSGGGVKFNDR